MSTTPVSITLRANEWDEIINILEDDAIGLHMQGLNREFNRVISLIEYLSKRVEESL